MTVKSLDLSWIVVSNLDEAIKFYTNVVGLELKELNKEYGWAELSGTNGGARLGIAQASDHEPVSAGSNAVMTFTVDNLEKKQNEMSQKGAKWSGAVMEIPGQVKLLTGQDADGNKFQIVEVLRAHK